MQISQVFSPHSTPVVSIQTITPEMASTWLKSNTQKQRKLRKRSLERYARDMARGKWILNMTPIVFDSNEHLINGQHRLRACILAGVPFQSAVARNVDPAALSTIDTEGTRTMANILQMKGINNQASMAAAGRLLYAYERYARDEFGWTSADTVGKSELTEFIEARMEELSAAASKFMYSKPLKSLLTQAWVVFLYVIFARQDAMLAEAFFKTLETGENLHADDPMYTLRQRLLESASVGRKSDRMDALLAVTIKTWNRIRKNEKAKQILVWKPNAGEQFPKAI